MTYIIRAQFAADALGQGIDIDDKGEYVFPGKMYIINLSSVLRMFRHSVEPNTCTDEDIRTLTEHVFVQIYNLSYGVEHEMNAEELNELYVETLFSSMANESHLHRYIQLIIDVTQNFLPWISDTYPHDQSVALMPLVWLDTTSLYLFEY